MKTKPNKVERHSHLVILSKAYKREVFAYLNTHFRDELKRSIRPSGPRSDHAAERLQGLIRAKLADDGIRDAEDMYQIVIGTTAEDFWCDVLNDLPLNDVSSENK